MTSQYNDRNNNNNNNNNNNGVSTLTILMKNGRIRIYSAMLTRNACFVRNASVNDSNIRKAEHFKTMHKDNIPTTVKYAQR
jgi:hypothetical protein